MLKNAKSLKYILVLIHHVHFQFGLYTKNKKIKTNCSSYVQQFPIMAHLETQNTYFYSYIPNIHF